MNRRAFLGTTLLTSALLKTSMANILPPLTSFDHALLAINDLQAGIDLVKSKTGIEAVRGGSHPHIGTHNALLSLGDDQYLEILAPDPNASKLIKEYEFIRELKEGKMIMWAAHTKDIAAVQKIVQEKKYTNSGVNLGQRKTIDGKTLNWQTLNADTPATGAMPFFIEWGKDTTHPASTSPRGCTLAAFEISHPHPVAVQNVFNLFGLQQQIQKATDISFVLKVQSPKGLVEFR